MVLNELGHLASEMLEQAAANVGDNYWAKKGLESARSTVDRAKEVLDRLAKEAEEDEEGDGDDQ